MSQDNGQLTRKVAGCSIYRMMNMTSYRIGACYSNENLTMRMLRRAGLSLSPSAKCHLYKTLIRPIIEYGSPAMTNISKDLQNCLKKFQRRVLRTSRYNGDPLGTLAHRRLIGGCRSIFQPFPQSAVLLEVPFK